MLLVLLSMTACLVQEEPAKKTPKPPAKVPVVFSGPQVGEKIIALPVRTNAAAGEGW